MLVVASITYVILLKLHLTLLRFIYLLNFRDNILNIAEVVVEEAQARRTSEKI